MNEKEDCTKWPKKKKNKNPPKHMNMLIFQIKHIPVFSLKHKWKKRTALNDQSITKTNNPPQHFLLIGTITNYFDIDTETTST